MVLKVRICCALQIELDFMYVTLSMKTSKYAPTFSSLVIFLTSYPWKTLKKIIRHSKVLHDITCRTSLSYPTTRRKKSIRTFLALRCEFNVIVLVCLSIDPSLSSVFFHCSHVVSSRIIPRFHALYCIVLSSVKSRKRSLSEHLAFYTIVMTPQQAFTQELWDIEISRGLVWCFQADWSISICAGVC